MTFKHFSGSLVLDEHTLLKRWQTFNKVRALARGKDATLKEVFSGTTLNYLLAVCAGSAWSCRLSPHHGERELPSSCVAVASHCSISLVAEQGSRVHACSWLLGSGARWLGSCGSPAWLLHGTWDPPGPGIEPMSRASAGGFFTTEPPGKSLSRMTSGGIPQDTVSRY